jgi:hypothetical protein
MVRSPQWLHLLLRAKSMLNSLLHFLQVGSEPADPGGGPLRSGRPLGVLMVECGEGLLRDNCATDKAWVGLQNHRSP